MKTPDILRSWLQVGRRRAGDVHTHRLSVALRTYNPLRLPPRCHPPSAEDRQGPGARPSLNGTSNSHAASQLKRTDKLTVSLTR